MSELSTIIPRVRAKPSQEACLPQELKRLPAPTRAEAGCISYDLHQSQSDPALFVFYETWASQAALEAHFEAPHLQTILKLVPELVKGPLDSQNGQSLNRGEVAAPDCEHLVQNLDENIPGASRARQRQASVTTERDDMEMAALVVANRFFSHGKGANQKPRPFPTKGSGTLKSETSHSALTYWGGIIQL